MLRRACVGKPVDVQELELYSLAAEEMDQFRLGILNLDRINQILR